MEYKKIIHGSENSLDIDAYVLVDKPYDNQPAKELCAKFPELNANLIQIENGKVVWCYKGTLDECNNSILETYSLHQQEIDNPVTIRVERNYGLKMLRTIRGLLSYCSRTQHREIVKKALQSGDLDKKLEVLKTLDLRDIVDFDKNTKIEAYKFFAFQMGQSLALLQDNVELFTKNSVAKYYPELTEYLNRKETSVDNLHKFWQRFVDFVGNNYQKVEHHDLFVVNFNGKKQVLDCKKEIVLPPVVVFDVDGTLMDEKHRAHLRDEKKWDEYFDLCHLDTPIKDMVDLLKDYKEKGYEIWIMTGRKETCKDKTLQSFKEAGIEYHHLKMRGENVMIPDYVLKPAWIGKYIGKERVEAIYDDSPRVLEGFIKKGLNAIHVETITGNDYRNDRVIKAKI